MPTQEERLNTLEKSFTTFREVASKHIQETDENITIMLGVIRHQGQDIRRIVQHLETIDERLGTMDEHLNSIEQRFNRLETKSDEHTTLLTQILARLPEAP